MIRMTPCVCLNTFSEAHECSKITPTWVFDEWQWPEKKISFHNTRVAKRTVAFKAIERLIQSIVLGETYKRQQNNQLVILQRRWRQKQFAANLSQHFRTPKNLKPITAGAHRIMSSRQLIKTEHPRCRSARVSAVLRPFAGLVIWSGSHSYLHTLFTHKAELSAVPQSL